MRRPHIRKHGFDQVHGPPEIGVKQTPGILRIALLHRRPVTIARVIYQHINGAEALQRHGSGAFNRAELAPLGIKVMVVQPGAFRTEFAGRSLTQSKLVIADYENTAGARRYSSRRSFITVLANFTASEPSSRRNGGSITTLLREAGIAYLDYGGQTAATWQGVQDGIALARRDSVTEGSIRQWSGHAPNSSVP